MLPVRTGSTNLTYRGDGVNVVDLPCYRVRPGQIGSVWALDDAERARVVAGANIELMIHGEPIPPVWVGVTHVQAVGRAPEPTDALKDMLGHILKTATVELAKVPPEHRLQAGKDFADLLIAACKDLAREVLKERTPT